jgi:hypothetical protein
MGNRRTGRPSIKWMDDVCKDTKMMNMKNCIELALNRNPGDCFVKKAKTHKGF